MEKRWYWLGGFIIVGLLLAVGVLLIVTRPPMGKPVTLLPPPTPAPIMVYVSGKVSQAGLYSLPPGSRVNDAIQAAGGFSSDANSSTVNLAGILEDGQRIDVPGIASQRTSTDEIQPLIQSAAVVDINTATLELLDTLPGIGPIHAQDIVDYRDKNGFFKKIEDIMDVPGIGQAKFDAIKDLITVGTSP